MKPESRTWASEFARWLLKRPGVCGDAARLGQALRNLTDNAAQHAVSQVAIGVRTEGGLAIARGRWCTNTAAL